LGARFQGLEAYETEDQGAEQKALSSQHGAAVFRDHEKEGYDERNRPFLQTKIDPSWNWNGRDFVHEKRQVPGSNDAYFRFCTIARRDPDPGGQCPDCLKYRSNPKVSAA